MSDCYYSRSKSIGVTCDNKHMKKERVKNNHAEGKRNGHQKSQFCDHRQVAIRSRLMCLLLIFCSFRIASNGCLSVEINGIGSTY